MQQLRSHSKYKKWWPAFLFLFALALPVAARSPLLFPPRETAAARPESESEKMPGVPREEETEAAPPAERAEARDEGDEMKATPPTAAVEREPAARDVEVLLVNKERPLPADYVPPDLRAAAIPFNCPEDSPKRLLRAEAADAVERLVAQAGREGIELVGVSAYRSYARQKEIFEAKAARLGEEAANQYSARPGESEHQTGLAIDISSPAVGGNLTESLAETPAGQWLARNAPAFGFIIRYPAGKEEVTGYRYEPWHLRYVGVEQAQAMTAKEQTLEEYLLARGM